MKKFEKEITKKILPNFDNAQDWSDLMTVMKTLKEELKNHKDFYNMAELNDKSLIAKRLAQCLNPQLPPGLHEITLEVYDILFDNIRINQENFMGEDLGLYCSGLFPFFQYASNTNKNNYLNLVKKHILALNTQELNVCLPGLIVSVLPGMEDQNEALHKIIKEVLNKCRSIISDSVFFGNFWAVILRTQRVRLGGLKYLVEAIPSYKIYEEKEEIKRDYITNFYPNLHVLVINSLTAVVEDDVVFVQRFALDFVINHFPIKNSILNFEEKTVLVVSALNLLFKNEYSTTRRLFTWLLGSDHDDEVNTEDPGYILMTNLLVEALKIFFQPKNVTKEKIEKGLKIIDSLLKHQVELVNFCLENVSIDILICVKTFVDENTNLNLSEEMIRKTQKFFKSFDSTYLTCLWISLEKMVFSNTTDFQKVFECSNLLGFCLTNIYIEDIERMNNFYLPIVSHLIRSLTNFKLRTLDDLNSVQPIINLCLSFLKVLKEKQPLSLNQLQTTKFLFWEAFNSNIKEYQKDYIQLCEIFLSQNSQKQVNIKQIKLFQSFTELMIKLQEYLNEDSDTNETQGIPVWIDFLVKICFCSNIALSLEGIYYLLDLIVIESENQVFKKIRNFVENSQNADSANFVKRSSIFINNNQPLILEMCMARLWSLLEEPVHQKKIIELIIKFFKTIPKIFSSCVSNTFQTNKLDLNVNGIKKFSQFWKLTFEYYPNFIFFENGESIFNMLDFLDNDHPLLRHMSKSWLSQSLGSFNKIIDPLLGVLMGSELSWFLSHQKKLFFVREYDNRKIIGIFRKLKNIIINMPDQAMSFFIHKKPQTLFNLDETRKEIFLKNREEGYYYIELLESISLSFIQAKFVESINHEFYRENLAVNAASCEFLEFLISFVNSHDKISIAQRTANILFEILKESIINSDEVMQVQLLNLLKVLLFDTSSVHMEYKNQLTKIFNSKTLHDCLLMGIQINYLFVRSHYISFVEGCLPIFSEILDQSSNLDIANRLIQTTCEFLFLRVNHYSNFFKENYLKDLSEEKLIFFVDNNFFAMKNYIEEYKDMKNFEENDVNVIINGLRKIIFHFIGIVFPIVDTTQIQWDQIKKSLQSKTTGTSFKDYLSSLFSSNYVDKNNEKIPVNLISNEIYKTFDDVLAALICCWVNESEIYMNKDLCLCENGIMPLKPEDIAYQRNITKNLELNDAKETKSTKIFKTQIIDICRNIFVNNPYEFINCFLNLWLNENHKFIQTDSQFKLSMVELLVNLNSPFDIIILAIMKNINQTKISEVKKSKVKINGVYPVVINFEFSCYEAKICHLIYSLIAYDTNLKLDSNSYNVWEQMNLFFNIFSVSNSPTTQFWIYEIIDLMMNKVPITDLNEGNHKSNLIYTMNKLFLFHMKYLNNKLEITFDQPKPMIIPLNPSIYELVCFEVYSNSIVRIGSKFEKMVFEKMEDQSINSTDLDRSSRSSIFREETNILVFYKNIYKNIKDFKFIKPEELVKIYRNIAFITAKNLFLSTSYNLFNPERIDKMTSNIKDVVISLLQLMQKKNNDNQIYVDLSTEFLHSIMENASLQVSTSSKNEIVEFFLISEFFNMSKDSLRLWKDIINKLSSYNQDILLEFISKLNTSSSIFSKSNDNLKVKALRRLSFIIYASPKDTYSSKLNEILEKVKDLISSFAENSLIEAEIFLLIRVMFLKFSHVNLVEMLKHLWPIIFNELVTIINKKKKISSPDLTLASLKLIELLSLANMEEFCLHQWVFVFDTFNKSSINSLVNSKNTKSFTPFVLELIKNNVNIEDENREFKHNEYDKRGLILEVQKLLNSEDTCRLVSSLVYYIALMNNFRGKIDWDSIENVIETDFLNSITNI